MIKDLVIGKDLELSKINKEAHKTQPPARFTETSLIQELENKGIGRPSTFASIVSVIQERDYVKKSKNQLYPTFLGIAVAKILSYNFPTFTDYNYTSKMEQELDDIAEYKITREKFLDSFWNGAKGFEKTIENIQKNIDWNVIQNLSTININDKYNIKYNRFGSWLEDKNSKENDSGFHNSIKLSDDENLSSVDFKNIDVCDDIFKNGTKSFENKELGVLDNGFYKGWVVSLKDGKYGPFVQAVNPKNDKANPINYSLEKDVDLNSITLDSIKNLFDDIKLPRWSNDKKWGVGIGKKGPWIAFKKTPKGRISFIGLPKEYDPKTVDFDTVKKIWDEKKK